MEIANQIGVYCVVGFSALGVGFLSWTLYQLTRQIWMSRHRGGAATHD